MRLRFQRKDDSLYVLNSNDCHTTGHSERVGTTRKYYVHISRTRGFRAEKENNDCPVLIYTTCLLFT